LAQHHCSLVILDPIYKTLPARSGSENDSAMITQLLNEVELITVETGAAVLFCSHFSKGNQAEKEVMDRVSGSGAWARDPDSLLMMTAHEADESFTVDGVLRNLPPIKPFVVHWEYPLFVRDQDADPTKLKKAGSAGRPVEHSPEQLMERLTVEGVRPGKLVKDLHEFENVGRGTVYRMKDELIKQGRMKIENNLWKLVEQPPTWYQNE
jgi:hypothetical protein